ncbi:hypothetical protein SD340_002935 [Vibrio fluvialis]|nr:hypothetical protein [Vibrio fluvialis]ELC0658915.1 hypothetical protein [Vibrio fluvialis]ELL4668372.1 hypothetical protein [Vibrio fluvialis]ELU8401054.1 hypothetical protein [Vibrio fluvialis]
MQIIIPMSGFGERFRKVGYKVPKPLIEVEGKPIIAHVIDMFPSETDFIFICNQDHLNEQSYQMANILSHYCPTGKIVGIEPHKLGPVHAVLKVKELIDLDKPTVVNYCDFTCYWDWLDFKQYVSKQDVAGAIPAYKGFHPHSLGTTNYAYLNEKNGFVLDIQEKQPFTNNRMEEFASSGTYYFSSGRILIDAFESCVNENLHVDGEFYVSLAYKPLLSSKQRIAVYGLQHFMQWGTPQDVQEYNYWSNIFKGYVNDSFNTHDKTVSSVVIPLAGLGQRFINEGYNTTKPLISVSGKHMVSQAINDLPCAEQYCFVVRNDMPGVEDLKYHLVQSFNNSKTVGVDGVTQGQACSALIGAKALGHFDGPVTFGACDNGALYDKNKLSTLMSDENVDVIVWSIRGYCNAIREPHMFGWIDVDDNDNIKSISVKKPLSTPEYDPIVLGTFTFKKLTDFYRVVDSLFERKELVNGEYYLDSCINDALKLGLKCKTFEVNSFVSWGTPNDLKTFEYWQSCFHKWQGHPYDLGLDRRVLVNKIEELNRQFRTFTPYSFYD